MIGYNRDEEIRDDQAVSESPKHAFDNCTRDSDRQPATEEREQ